MTEQRSPEEIRAQIDQAREELADTAAALAYKADVKARSQERVQEVKADMRAKADGLKTTVTGRVNELKSKASSGGSSDSGGGAAESAKAAAASAQVKVKQNPVQSAAVAAALLGFAIGYLMARRRH